MATVSGRSSLLGHSRSLYGIKQRAAKDRHIRYMYKYTFTLDFAFAQLQYTHLQLEGSNVFDTTGPEI